MKDILTKLSENLASSFARVTDDNEMFNEAKYAYDDKEAIAKKVEEVETQIKALEAELEIWKSSNVFKKAIATIQQNEIVKAFAKLQKKNANYWKRYTEETNPKPKRSYASRSSWGSCGSSSSGGCGSRRSDYYYGGCGSGGYYRSGC